MVLFSPIVRKTILVGLLLLALVSAGGCRLGYLLHAASGQFSLLFHAVPVEQGLESDLLTETHRTRLRLVAAIKRFGEGELGLRKTDNYETVYLKSRQNPIYTISASPKDRLQQVTWWFPIVGDMPYLGFFDRRKADEEAKKLRDRDLDVVIGEAVAYSTLGWFQDPVTLNLLEENEIDLADTILHEMTHATLYRKGQGAFNEGLAMLVGRVGACLFAERMYGPSNPLTRKAGERLQEQRLFSAFLNDLLDELKGLYDSEESYQNKLRMREDIFQRHLQAFNRLRARFKTNTFSRFGEATWNNAYLLSIGLYHRNFRHFEAVLKQNGGDLKTTIETCRAITDGEKDAMEAVTRWLMKHPSISSAPRITQWEEQNPSIGPFGVLVSGLQHGKRQTGSKRCQ